MISRQATTSRLVVPQWHFAHLKIRSEDYLLLPPYINWSKTKISQTKTLLQMIDYSVRNPGEVEHDKQNWLQLQRT